MQVHLVRALKFQSIIFFLIGAGIAIAGEKTQVSVVEEASNSPAAQAILKAFSETYAGAKTCAHRPNAVRLLYSDEYRRILFQQARAPITKEETNVVVGIAIVTAHLVADQFKDKQLPTTVCDAIRLEIDTLVPIGYGRE
jgi:hypothetical protein